MLFGQEGGSYHFPHVYIGICFLRHPKKSPFQHRAFRGGKYTHARIPIKKFLLYVTESPFRHSTAVDMFSSFHFYRPVGLFRRFPIRFFRRRESRRWILVS